MAAKIIPRSELLIQARTDRSRRVKADVHKVRVGNVTIEFRLFKVRGTNRDGTIRMRTELRARGAKRQTFKTRAAAIERAEEIAPEIAAGRAPISPETKQLFTTITKQWIEYRRITADERPLEIVTGELFTEKARAFDGRKTTTRFIPELVAEFLADIEARSKRQGSSMGHWRNLRGSLKKFAEAFTGPVTVLDRRSIHAWLKSLPYAAKTVNHYRAAIVEALNFAKGQGYCTREFVETISEIPAYDAPKGRATPYAAAELKGILEYAEVRAHQHVPWMAIVAFGGARVSEASKLDWSDINFRRRRILVREEIAKTVEHYLYVPDNLLAWLKPYARPSGLICPVQSASKAFTNLCESAKAARKRNGLRSGFISHHVDLFNDWKLTARVAGTSVEKIHSNYFDLQEPGDAEAWFNIFPAARHILWQPGEMFRGEHPMKQPQSPHRHHAPGTRSKAPQNGI